MLISYDIKLHLIVLTTIIFSTSLCQEFKETKKEEDEFIPTGEWQVVKKGQKLPKGLHIRMNFETGITEAKLLDEKEKNNALLEIPQEENQNGLPQKEVIKESLRNIKNDAKIEAVKRIKNHFRSYAQLKEEMHNSNLTPKTDAEVLKDLLKKHKQELEKEKIDIKSISRILEDIDFLAHQIDNGVEFIKQNGFNEIIYKNLNMTNNQVKEDTLRLLGSLLQNNPKVQVHALESGAIPTLLRILSLEPSTLVKSRAVFALSCLLRRFPLAQLRFVENGGLTVVNKLFKKDPIKIQVKLSTLMNDLIVENIHAKRDNQNMVVNQYRLVNLENLLLEQNWCDNLNKLLISVVATNPENHDSIEKCIISMHTMVKQCMAYYDKDVLVTLQQRYKMLAENEKNGSDEYSSVEFFNSIYNLCDDILQSKGIKTEL